MRIKISPNDVQLGMYVCGFGGSWLNHPFWRSSFMLTDERDCQKLRESDVPWVEIDTEIGNAPSGSSGGSPAPSPLNPPAELTPEQKASRLAVLDRARAASYAQEIEPQAAPMSMRERAAESRRAAATIAVSRNAVAGLFDDVRLGRIIKPLKLERIVQRISNTMSRNPSIMLNIARIKRKDDYTYLHSVAVSALMVNLAREMRLDPDVVQELGVAGLMHDVGKVGVPEAILAKDCSLNINEIDVVRRHPRFGHELLAGSRNIDDITLEVCLHHHEKLDGSGYPDRLSSDAVSVYARMGAICDVYDAITSDRSYRQAWPASLALANMLSWKGHFDQLILRTFIRSLGVRPVGTLVQLKSGDRAVVVGEADDDMTRPLVRIIRRGENAVESTGPTILTGYGDDPAAIVAVESGDPDFAALAIASMPEARQAA